MICNHAMPGKVDVGYNAERVLNSLLSINGPLVCLFDLQRVAF